MKTKWFCMEEIQRVHPLMIAAPMRGFTEAEKYGIPKSKVHHGVVEFDGFTCWLYFVWDEFHKTGKIILEEILTKPAWAEKLNQKIIAAGEKYFDFAEKITKIDLKKLSNKELGKLYDDLYRLQLHSHGLGLAWVVLEFEHQLYTKYLLGYLEKKVKEKKKDCSLGEIFSILSTPLKQTFAQKEEKDLLKLAVKIQADEKVWRLFIKGDTKKILEKLPKINSKIDRAVQKHYETYSWLPFMYIGPAWPKAYFVEVLSKMVKQNADVKPLLEKVKKKKRKLAGDQKKYFKELNVDKKHQKLFEIAQGIVYTKAFRKDCLYHGCWILRKILKIIAKRLHLTVNQAYFLMPWEVRNVLITGEAPVDELNARMKYHVFWAERGEAKIMLGKKGKAVMKKIMPKKPKLKVEEIQELAGECACPGNTRGIVKVINTPEEMEKMKEGNVLVAHATNPDVVPAMKKAAAIVTDLGGMTCHAAIVSRELRIPCIVGTKMATKVFKDGEAVHVDATHGVIKKLAKE